MVGIDELQPNGWRARIGVIVPPNNVVNEAEFNRLKPDGVTYHFTRSPMHPNPSSDNYATLLNDVDIAVAELTNCSVNLVAYGCTAGSMACPAELLIGKMEEIGKVGAISTAGSILKALAALNVTKISMASPYTDETNQHEKEFFTDHGIEVVAMAGLSLNTSPESVKKMSRVPPPEIYALAKSVDRPESEAILICCTDFGSLDIVQTLEYDLGKPVITSNTSTFWASLRAAGLQDRLEGYGSLLAEH
jgi:maleate cis-trans isomerase